MSFIEFESAREKERIRQELRDVRAEILRRAEEKAKEQDERKKKEKLENDWMLPSVSNRIDRMAASAESKPKKKKSKKSKKVKKEKKSKKKKKKRSSSSDGSSSDEERIKKKKKKKKKFSETSSSSSSESDGAGDEWVEKGDAVRPRSIGKAATESEKPLMRDDWMGGLSLPTFTKNELNPTVKKEERRGLDAYDPAKSALELNPHWKTGTGGLPTFRKPSNDLNDERDGRRQHGSASRADAQRKSASWRKTDAGSRHGEKDSSRRRSRSRSPRRGRRDRRRSTSSSSRSGSRSPTRRDSGPSTSHDSAPTLLTDQEFNDLAASQIKAEISGNVELAKELQAKLEKARQARKASKDEQWNKGGDDVLLTVTNSKGLSRPLQNPESELWGGRAGRKAKKQKVETHIDGERVRYFADDDKYDIKQMFEREKYSSAADQDIEFATIAGKHKNPNDELEDLFTDNASKRAAEEEYDRKERERAIHEHQQIVKTLEECDKCIASEQMKKHLIVAMGTHVYVSLPWHEGLQYGHCVIVPLAHVSCATQLDEDVWTEMLDFMRALNQMFSQQKKDVIFFETARYLNKRPHMQIQCIPSRKFELAPFYFKKAILESEEEWATNKQLIDLKGRDVRRAVPKGLPYFWVKFGMNDGFGHVIEDQSQFPAYFAQEVLGGLLEMEPRRWKKPSKIQNAREKAQQFAQWWEPFDITKQHT